MLKGRGVWKTKNMKPNLQTPNKALYRPWEWIIDTFELIMQQQQSIGPEFWLKSAIVWAIIGEFDNFSQI